MFSRITDPVSTKLSNKASMDNGDSNLFKWKKGHTLSPVGDNSEMAKIQWLIDLFLQNHSAKFN